MIEHLEQLKPFKVIYDGDDFGIYKYNEKTNRYEGCIGYMEIPKMVEIIKDKDSFINLEVANEID